MKNKATLGLCMIVKDEEKNIARCIGSVRSIVDEIVVVDTGSTDNTVKIAEELGAEVCYYPWDNSFSNAKNFAIGKAGSEWLLLLDADEALDTESAGAVVDFINTTALDGAHFRVRNYTGSFSPENYSLHIALRLLRNNGRYRYTGNIHEQIVRDEPGYFYDRFATLDVILHHYGYLESAVAEKQKRKRNIPILEKELEDNPNDAFTLFNLGNEYLTENSYAAALEYYEKSKALADNTNKAFVPHLYFRMINCHESLGHYQPALDLLNEALRIYAECTDYEFVRANIYFKCRRYTLAVASLEKCLKMGNSPPSLEFISGCGTYKAAFLLGDIYSQLEDYEKAFYYFSMALSAKPDMYVALYGAGHALGRLCRSKDDAAERLFAFFADPRYPPNIIVGTDILIGEGLCQQALRVLELRPGQEEYACEYAYLAAKAKCLLGHHEESLRLLDTVIDSDGTAGLILTGVRSSCAQLYFVNGLMLNKTDIAEHGLHLATEMCSLYEQNACRLLYGVFTDTAPAEQIFEDGGASELETMLSIFNIILRLKDFQLFQKLMRAFNYIDREDLLLKIARLFWDNDYKDMAASFVLRSVRELDVIDETGASILSRHIGRLTRIGQDGLSAVLK